MTFRAKHFTLDELLHSDVAARRGIGNVPDAAAVANLQRLADTLLDPLREAVGAPLRVTSGYRSPELNAAVGGAPRSAHLTGRAADLVWWGRSPDDLAAAAEREDVGLAYDKLIIEFGAWVHIQIAPPGVVARKQVLTAERGPDGRAVYRTA